MKRRGCGFVEAAARDHAVAITCQAVTGRTKDLIALLSAFENFFRDRKRKSVRVIGKHYVRSAWCLRCQCIRLRRFLAEIKLPIRAQVTTGHSTCDRRP